MYTPPRQPLNASSGRLDGPGDAQHLAQTRHAAARLEPRRQRGPCVETEAMVVEGPCAPAVVHVRLQHGHVQSALGEQGACRQPIDARADYDDLIYQPACSSPRVRQPRYANRAGIPTHISAPASLQNG